ncbi:MAG TPA: Fic family protein [Longimicrobiales bacterium]|nr:Fic family protein [Longimicrobiales bacterium]
MRGTLVSKTWEYDPTLYAPPRYRQACRYDAFVPARLAGEPFRLSSSVVGVVSDAEQAIASLNATAHPALEPLARLLLRTESIASSRVEGMQVGIRQLARAESRMETGGRASPTVLEVIGNVDAMQLAVDEAASAASIGLPHLTEIHARLMANAPNSHVAGLVRTTQNWIGGNDYNPCGADFVPPPPEHVEPLLLDLCQAIGDESLPPLVQAAMVHAQFETIHPFDDGNGRTGRALVHVVLRHRGIASSYVPPISVVLAADRERYIEGLTHFREGDLESWIERFSVAAAQAARLAEAYLGAVAVQMERWRDALAAGDAPRADAAAWAVIDVLPAHPVITAPVAAAATGRAKAAIHQAVKQLEGCGVLIPLSESRRNRSWEADGLLELLEGLEGGRLPTSG